MKFEYSKHALEQMALRGLSVEQVDTPMNLKYDVETDILYIKLSEKPIIDSDEDKPGLIFDFSEDGSLVGIEVLNASKNIDDLHKISISGAVGEYSFAIAA